MRNKITQVVTVDISHFVPKTVCEYAIMCDRTMAELLAYSAAHPGCFVFPFCTRSVEDVDDFSALSSDYIAVPLYVGNMDYPASVIRQVVDVHLGPLKPDAICLLDESP